MRRRLFNFAAAVSLVLFLGTAGLWLRSYWRTDGFSFWTTSGLLELRTRRGKLILDNEPQRALDRRPLEIFANKRKSIETRIQPLLRQLGDADSAWQRDPNRFNKGAAAGAAARAANLRMKLDEPERQFFAMDQLGRRWLRKVRISPPMVHTMPLYVPLIAMALLPGTWLVLAQLTSRRTRRRQRMKECRKCRYNLTGNTSGVCPECGTPVAGKAECQSLLVP